jgi:NitT/TauT family transport system substrate-binding protein
MDCTRREFVSGLTLAGTTGFLGMQPATASAEPPPETKRIRLAHTSTGTCWAPQYVAEDMLRAEGFSDLRYVKVLGSEEVYPALASGELDISMAFIAPFIVHADAGGPLVMLAGIHTGCIELYGSERVRTVRDLKGRTVSVVALNSAPHAFIASMLTYVGIDPRRDINLVVQPREEAMRQFAEGKIDALITAPPWSYATRAKKIGHVLVNMTVDRPWSQYFCCVLTGNREFVRRNPVATKRAMRAILKGANLCATNPESSARFLAGRAFAPSYEAALQTVREVPYASWRDFDTEDTIRFYALRLHEAGMIKSSPQKILAQGTDWRFLNELKKELKG